MNALKLEIKTNFKDDALTQYGNGDNFSSFIRDNGIIFESLPAPKPSLQARTVVTSMGRGYNCSSNPCFHEDCVITVFRNDKNIKIKLSDLNTEDIIINENEEHSKIKYILQTKCKNNKNEFVRIHNNLLITPYHPVFINNKWIFPIDITDNIENLHCNYIYSISLENGNSMFINNVRCIALGHGIENDPVASHEFFGKEIDEKIKEHPYYLTRRIILNSNSLIRDEKSNLINNIKFDEIIVN